MNEWIPQSSRERWNEYLAIRCRLEVLRKTTEEDAGIGSDSWFGIGLSFREETEEIVVEDSIGEFWSDEEYRLDGSFSNDRYDISESSQL